MERTAWFSLRQHSCSTCVEKHRILEPVRTVLGAAFLPRAECRLDTLELFLFDCNARVEKAFLRNMNDLMV